MNRPAWLAALGLCTALGCASTSDISVTPYQPVSPEWRQLFADDRFTVSIDAAHIQPGPEPDTVEVWYQNRHAVPREDRGIWNREVIHSLLRCEPLEFKTILVTVFLDDGPPVAQIGGSLDGVRDLPWRTVTPNSVDEGSLRGACEVAASLGFDV